MDCFSDNRAALMAHLPNALQAAEQQQNNLDAGMTDMFASIDSKDISWSLLVCDPWDEMHRLIMEKEALGLFLTGHPLLMVENEVRQISPTSLARWLDKLDTGMAAENGYRQKEQPTRVCGLVVDIRTKKRF